MVDAREYHERTNHSPSELRNSEFSLDPRTKPRPYKVYRDLPRIDLPSIRPPQGPALAAVSEPRAEPVTDATDRSGEFDREMLATLCYEASGVVREVTAADGRELRFRAASCTGKLYHVDLYAVCGDLPDLAAGVYHFDPSTMALDVLREDDYRGTVAEAVGDGSTGVAGAPVTFVATSTWWRNAWKYRERTYRHAFWDSGTVLANLLSAAHATDRRAEVYGAFADDPIADLIGVDPEEEGPVALAPVGSGDPVPDPRPVEPIDPATEPLSPDREEYPLIHEAWRSSTLPDGDGAREWRGRVWEAVDGSGGFDSQPADRGNGEGEQINLEPVGPDTASARPLHATIRRRGSCREYAREGPSRRQVGTILDRATRGVPADWNSGAPDGLAFNTLYALVTGVSEIPDGSYRYRPDEDALVRIGGIDREGKARLALDQSWAGAAHVNVYMLADVEGIVEEFGNRGYRLAQLEAGLTLGRLYLATYAHRELGGLGLTFFDDLVAERLAEGERTPTCLYAFGTRRD